MSRQQSKHPPSESAINHILGVDFDTMNQWKMKYLQVITDKQQNNTKPRPPNNNNNNNCESTSGTFKLRSCIPVSMPRMGGGILVFWEA